ncbi:MAG: xanthine dehydrogenase family protein molybdopterin-binding subunit, partial [candidate division NC10 bacterium]
KVRYVGEPVALVVARDRYVAEDALASIAVEYEPLPVVVDPEAALAPGAPLLHEESGSNLAWHRVYRHGDPDRAFAEAEVVIRERFRFPRYSSTPMETYGVVAAHDPITGILTLWSNFQGLYAMFYVLARSLGLREDKFRLVVSQDVGGSFGTKSGVYPYMTLCGFAAMKTGRPVKWIEDRHEHLISSMCNADRVTEIALAATRDGAITAMKLKVLDNVGAYIRSPEPACTLRAYSNLVGPYRIQGVEFDASIAYTNLMPSGSNRGYGCVALYFALERTMDLLAKQLGLDPAEIRLRNFIAPNQFPYTTPTGGIYDSGDYPACLTKALAMADYEGLRKEQRKAREEGRHVGIGVAVAVDPSASNIGYITLAFDPEQRKKYLPKSGTMETATVGIDGLGKITVRLSTAPHGQGHETVSAQIAADALGVRPDAIHVINEFDTFRSPWSFASGTYSSRFGSVGMSAVAVAAGRLREKLCRIAAHLLEAHPKDLELKDGKVSVRGAPGRAGPLKHVSGFAHWNSAALLDAGIQDPFPSVTATFTAAHLKPPDAQDRVSTSVSFAFIAEVAAVEVERATGVVRILKYVSVHDAGRIVNPMIAEGQILGSILHGLGGAMYEEMAYDENGQPLAGSFMDYLCPTAVEAPRVEIAHIESLSPFTTLGTKGLGEGSTETAPVAIANAVADALAPLGVGIHELPLSPLRVWSLIRSLDRPGA